MLVNPNLRSRSAAALLVLLGLFGAACSSHGSDSASAGSTQTTSTASSGGGPSGKPIPVMMTTDIESATISFPGNLHGATAAIDAANDRGGIQGRPIDLIKCDNSNDPNMSADCGRQAADDGVVVALGGSNPQSATLLPVLEQARIAYVGNRAQSAPDNTSPMSFPVGGGSSELISLGRGIVSVGGCKAVGVVGSDLPAARTVAAALRTGITHEGGSVTSEQYIDPNLPDLAPVVASAFDDGAKCIGVLVDPRNALRLLTAIRQSGHNEFAAAPSTVFSDKTLAQAGDAAEGVLVSSSTVRLDDPNPEMQRFRDEMARYQPGEAVDPVSLQGWMGAQVALKALAAIKGDITNESFVHTLTTMGPIDLKIMAPIDFGKELNVKGRNRTFVTSSIIMRMDRGTLKTVSNGFVDASALLSEMAAGG